MQQVDDSRHVLGVVLLSRTPRAGTLSRKGGSELTLEGCLEILQ